MKRPLLAVLAGALGFALPFATPAPASAAPFTAVRSAPDGAARSAPPPTGRIVVELAAKADLAPARAVPGWAERGQSVTAALQRHADASNRAVVGAVARVPGARLRPFWIHNSVVVEGATPALRAQLAQLPGVRAVRDERSLPLTKPLDPKQAVLAAAGTPEWGVARIGAERAWDRGALGGGVVVATIDSGVDHLHPAITQQYRGNLGNGTFDHNYNWFDASRSCPSSDPCDLHGHGTHTMGTIVGGDGPGPFTPDVGVAPAARWISAGCGPNFCTESQLLEAAQFILAPFGDAEHPADPDKRPDIVSNSWGFENGDDPLLLDLVRAWKAAGIVPVFSAGNTGPACSTTPSPGDYAEVLTVGATDAEDVVADFSSRGPTVSGAPKPEVSAPGVDVVSAVPGGGYEALSGTSMAAPHVAGALALALGSAPRPEAVADLDRVTGALTRTAVDRVDLTCGGDADGDPNNTYGEGRIDADATVTEVAEGGTLAGTVSPADAGAKVTTRSGGREFATFVGPDGSYRLFLPVGTYDLTVTAFGYRPASRTGVVVARDETVTADVALAAAPTFAVAGTVTAAETGTPMAGVQVEVLGVPRSAVTDGAGRYRIDLPSGTYRVRTSRGGCVAPQTVEVVVDDDAVTRDLRLAARTDRFGHGCEPLGYEWTDTSTRLNLSGDDEYGRLSLPFSMPFYGSNYRAVYVTTNGWLSFVDPGWAASYNEALPTLWEPNAAIYPLWQNLAVEGDASITWGRSGLGSSARVVISFNDLRVVGTDQTVTFQVRLWANGTIDVIYADVAAADDGAHATIGLESPDGTDALQAGYNEPVATSGTAWRYREVTSGVVRGSVVDANDGRALAGATVTAMPGGRSAVTNALGRYELKLIPGSYTLEMTARNYAKGTVAVTPRGGATTSATTVRLATGIATVTPASLSFTSAAGQTTEQAVTLTNTGSAPLTFQVDDRTDPPALPPGTPAPLRPILTDPAGDALHYPVDVVDVSAVSTSTTLSMAITFSEDTNMGAALGIVHLDTDQDPATGVPVQVQGGHPAQDTGVEFVINLFNLHFEPSVVDIFRADTDQHVGSAPGRIEGKTMRFDVPLRLLGRDDGNIDVSMLAASPFGITDWVPDRGHGTVEVRQDAPWLTATPPRGVLAPGASVTIAVQAGSPTLPAGRYTADLRVSTDAGRVPRRLVPVTLRVT